MSLPFRAGSVLPVIIAVVVILLLGGGYLLRSNQSRPSDSQSKPTTLAQLSPRPAASPGGPAAGQSPPATTAYQGTVLAGTTAPLIDYNPTDYQAALATDELIVLYFYANWCPICKEEVVEGLYPAFNELANGDVIGFRVNFNDSDTDDEERQLARQFGVAYQHTKVFLRGGQRVLKSPEAWDKARYDNEIAAHRSL